MTGENNECRRDERRFFTAPGCRLPALQSVSEYADSRTFFTAISSTRLKIEGQHPMSHLSEELTGLSARVKPLDRT